MVQTIHLQYHCAFCRVSANTDHCLCRPVLLATLIGAPKTTGHDAVECVCRVWHVFLREKLSAFCRRVFCTQQRVLTIECLLRHGHDLQAAIPCAKMPSRKLVSTIIHALQ